MEPDAGKSAFVLPIQQSITLQYSVVKQIINIRVELVLGNIWASLTS